MRKIPISYQNQIKCIRQKELDYKNRDVLFSEETIKLKEELASAKTKRKKQKIMHKAIALCACAVEQVLHLSLYDVQLFGAIVLCEEKIAEMKTGEGKTLAAVPAAYFMALYQKGVHVITVNDYLAKTQWSEMKPVFDCLGITSGCITEQIVSKDRKSLYLCDVLYITNKELGFDYLRDNLVKKAEQKIMRPFFAVIIDEADSILIDEARTPLIISETNKSNKSLYYKAADFVKTLSPAGGDGIHTRFQNLKEEMMREFHDIDGDYVVDKMMKNVVLTSVGIEKAEEFFHVGNLSDLDHLDITDAIQDALYARLLMEKDKDYIVKDNQIFIVDEFTGRIMHDRRFAEGIHQAIEAKENVSVQNEDRISAEITIQNLFKLYPYLSGMTGTAYTSAEEFKTVYDLNIVQIPTNKPMIRKDLPDVYFPDKQSCYQALIDDILERHQKQQPVLIGTQSVKESEEISSLLTKNDIKHQLLNAKYHEQEAKLISQAGKPSAVTIATNMAGRGTDILLGGNPDIIAKQEAAKQVDLHSETYQEDFFKIYQQEKEKQLQQCSDFHQVVVDAGGLYVIGVGRNTARRIDNQLIGRSGRQGDIGESRYYISYEDSLVSIYGKKRKNGKIFAKFPHAAKTIVSAAQRKTESISSDYRKTTFEMDSVESRFRETIYQLRDKILMTEDMSDIVEKIIHDCICSIRHEFNISSGKRISKKKQATLIEVMQERYQWVPCDFDSQKHWSQALYEQIKSSVDHKMDEIKKNDEDFDANLFFQRLFLHETDKYWKEFLAENTLLKTSSSMNVFGALTAMQAYKIESYALYQQMIVKIKTSFISYILTMETDQRLRQSV